MRLLIPVALAAFLAAPAWAQLRLENEPPPRVCVGNNIGVKATQPFVENINAASSAFNAGDWVATLNAVERARPHAKRGAQMTIVAQLEIPSMLQLGGEIAAIPKLELLLNDSCIGVTARQAFNMYLQQARANVATAPPH